MVIFSGIQPTGRKHLGNHIGAITQYVAGQERGDPAIYCIVDLHAITVRYEPEELRERVFDTTAILMAAGLDPERCVLFRQGDVQEHAELCWLLSSVTAIGELNRMHQFRDKSAAQRELVSAGLLFYPVLQAADVLAYRTNEVPVGEDQREHLELMRDVAERFNARFGEVLVVPEHRIPEVGARVRDLQEPDRKMSTTGGGDQGTVYVLDEPDVVRKKFRRAVTDSGSEIVRSADKPGVSNLIEILAVARGATPEDVERDFAGAGYGALKSAVGEAVADWLAPVRRALRRDPPQRGAPGGRAGGRRGQGADDRLRHAHGRPRGDGGGLRAPLRAAGRPLRRPRRLACTGGWPPRQPISSWTSTSSPGPFDLLLSLVLREELDLLEVELAEVVVAYLDHLEARDELDLEAATEFLVLIAALLELKSRLMLPGEEMPELEELAPGEAASELLERMLRYARFRGAGGWLAERHADAQGHLYRAAPLPQALRRAPLEAAEAACEPSVLGAALGGLLRTPPPIDLRHIAVPRVTVGERLAHLRALLRRGTFSFDEAVGGADRVTVAVTLFALLELYKSGEAGWEQAEPFGPITVSAAAAAPAPPVAEAGAS